MRYRNAKTGAIINVDSEIGGLWIPVDAKRPEKVTPAPTVPTAESVEDVKKTPAPKRTTKTKTR